MAKKDAQTDHDWQLGGGETEGDNLPNSGAHAGLPDPAQNGNRIRNCRLNPYDQDGNMSMYPDRPGNERAGRADVSAPHIAVRMHLALVALRSTCSDLRTMRMVK